ncbi:hypothetical protein [Streptosporangium sp. G12]
MRTKLDDDRMPGSVREEPIHDFGSFQELWLLPVGGGRDLVDGRCRSAGAQADPHGCLGEL